MQWAQGQGPMFPGRDGGGMGLLLMILAWAMLVASLTFLTQLLLLYLKQPQNC